MIQDEQHSAVRTFYQTFPIRDALRLELSWTHYRVLLRIKCSIWQKLPKITFARDGGTDVGAGTAMTLNLDDVKRSKDWMPYGLAKMVGSLNWRH